MKILFTAVGSRGDVQPMIALALEARQRGHSVQVGAPPDCASWVRSHNLDFAVIGCDIQAWLKSNANVLSGNPLTMLRGMQRYFANELPLQFPAMAQAARGCDRLVVGGLAFAGSSVAELLGIPLLTIAYSGCVLPSKQHPPPMIPWQGLAPWANRCL